MFEVACRADIVATMKKFHCHFKIWGNSITNLKSSIPPDICELPQPFGSSNVIRNAIITKIITLPINFIIWKFNKVKNKW